MSQSAAQPKQSLSPDIIAQHGLSEEEYARILEIMGREPNMVELGIFSVMWSEHCSYKTTRKWLKTLPTEAPHVICGPGENAGVIDIGDGQAAIFKMESHNHPSFIEPFQGAATGVGGILRDVFTMGARPVANMNALRFGDINHPKTKHLLSGVVAGIGSYGNCVGVPTVGGECTFHEAYNGNILVNAMNVGVADSDKIFYSAAAGIGNPVVYVGSKTGRDGIHGATMASAEFDDASEDKRPTVQVGDPFTEKLLIEACMELMATDAIIAIQDMGAAGLTSSSLEMAGKGGLGIELNLDNVPMRETAMSPYEIMLSESQERMLMVLKPEKEDLARKIFEKWELDFSVIGTLTDTKHLVLKRHGLVVCDMPVDPVSEDAPIYSRPYVYTPKPDAYTPNKETLEARDLGSDLLAMLATPDLCSKRWVWEQYDHMVGNNTIVRPGSDAAVVRVHGTEKALAISTDCTPRYCFADPIEGGKQAVAETWRNICASGAKPLAITNCLNFGNPEKPEIMGQIVGCIEGIKEACEVLEYPVISGNVSLYNETNGIGILPTPAIGGVGLLDDVEQVIGNSFSKAGFNVIQVGETMGHLGQSLYQRYMLDETKGTPPAVDLEKEKRYGGFIQNLAKETLVDACHDISDGGLLIALAEMSFKHDVGVHITYATDDVAFWFGESQARYIIAVDAKYLAKVQELAKASDIPLLHIGSTQPDAVSLQDGFSFKISELSKPYEAFLPTLMAQ